MEVGGVPSPITQQSSDWLCSVPSRGLPRAEPPSSKLHTEAWYGML